MYIVIECFDIYWPAIVTDEEGKPLLFDTLEEAQEEADECQDGKIFEVC